MACSASQPHSALQASPLCLACPYTHSMTGPPPPTAVRTDTPPPPPPTILCSAPSLTFTSAPTCRTPHLGCYSGRWAWWLACLSLQPFGCLQTTDLPLPRALERGMRAAWRGARLSGPERGGGHGCCRVVGWGGFAGFQRRLWVGVVQRACLLQLLLGCSGATQGEAGLHPDVAAQNDAQASCVVGYSF